MLLETASFRGDDDPALVRAALACSLCLSGAVDWTLEDEEWDARVVCACRECGHRRLVALNAEQTLRLYLVRSRERLEGHADRDTFAPREVETGLRVLQ